MAGKWREGKGPGENTAIVQTKRVLEANVKADGFTVQLAGQEDWPKVTGSWRFLDLKRGMTIALFMSPAIGISQCCVSPAPQLIFVSCRSVSSRLLFNWRQGSKA